MRAERDLERTVRQDESVTIGGSIETQIGASESRTVAVDQTLSSAGATSHVAASRRSRSARVVPPRDRRRRTGVAITSDKRIVLTTGQASIVLDGPNILLRRAGLGAPLGRRG
jgi:hypothetical protein